MAENKQIMQKSAERRKNLWSIFWKEGKFVMIFGGGMAAIYMQEEGSTEEISLVGSMSGISTMFLIN